jgi:hypothetical protein
MLECGHSSLEVIPAKVLTGEFGAQELETNRLGLELRVYSYRPTGLPTLVWAKVVDSEIYAIVSGSSVAAVEAVEAKGLVREQ